LADVIVRLVLPDRLELGPETEAAPRAMTCLAKAPPANRLDDSARSGEVRVHEELSIVEHSEVSAAEPERTGSAGDWRWQRMPASAARDEDSFEPLVRL